MVVVVVVDAKLKIIESTGNGKCKMLLSKVRTGKSGGDRNDSEGSNVTKNYDIPSIEN